MAAAQRKSRTILRRILPLFAAALAAACGVKVASPKPGVTSCGVASLFALSRRLGQAESFDRIDSMFGPHSQEVSMLDIKRVAARMGIRLSGRRRSLVDLLGSKRPFIAHLSRGHFVTVVGSDRGKVDVMEPRYAGDTTIFQYEYVGFERSFSGNALVLDLAKNDRRFR